MQDTDLDGLLLGECGTCDQARQRQSRARCLEGKTTMHAWISSVEYGMCVARGKAALKNPGGLLQSLCQHGKHHCAACVLTAVRHFAPRLGAHAPTMHRLRAWRFSLGASPVRGPWLKHLRSAASAIPVQGSSTWADRPAWRSTCSPIAHNSPGSKKQDREPAT